jgi:lipoprotein-releasing system permease protein
MIALALKYLFSKKRQTFLMLMGIFFGTAAYIAISGMMLGFREYLVDQLVNNSAHVHIQAREEFLTDHSLDKPYFGDIFSYVFWDVPPSGRKDSAMVENPQNWYRRLDVDPRVVAYSPQLTANVILANGKSTASTLMTGCNPMQQVQVTNIGEYVKQGSFADLAAGGNRIIVGSELQKMLGLRMSQNVFVSMGNGESTPFKVVGIFKTGNKMSDVAVFGAIGDVQRLNRTPNQINEIGV